MRPCSPVPCTLAKSTPTSRAKRRIAGPAATIVEAFATTGAAGGAGVTGAAGGAGAGVTGGAGVGGA